jgi:tetratricopeptide (TPR) repeat protein
MRILMAGPIGFGNVGGHFYYRDGERLLKAGKVSEALKVAEGCLREGKDWETKPALILKAECLQQLDTYESLQKAVAIYTQLYERYPDELIFLYRYAMLHEVLKEWVLARDAYEELIQKTKCPEQFLKEVWDEKEEENLLLHCKEERDLSVLLYQEGLERANKHLVR